MAEELRSEARTLDALIRWAALTGITLLVAKRLTGALFPNLILSSSWRPEFWWGSFAIEATFELFLLVLLLGVPYCIFRSRHASSRGLLFDCGTAVSLYLATLLLL